LVLIKELYYGEQPTKSQNSCSQWLNLKEGAASENANLFKWYGGKTYTGNTYLKYMQMVQYSQYGPTCVFV